MYDFTLSVFKNLLLGYQANGYKFQTFSQYLIEPKAKVVLLRYDIDKRPKNALILARIQNSLGIKGSFYFRAVKSCMKQEIIKEIASLGHEIGYHYENLATVSRRFPLSNDISKIYENGIKDFDLHLKQFREIVPVQTICMHGSPLSKFNSKDLWKKYDYSEFGIIGEPYIDLDFNEVFYLTDTGRRWDGHNVSLRDKINGYQSVWTEKGMVFKSSFEILEALNQQLLPQKIMMTFHPQRWNAMNLTWYSELISQYCKNPLKRILVKMRDSKNTNS